MPGMEWTLEIVLVGLLGATLFHAIRLERALGVLKRDRASLETLIEGFNASTRQAETGIERLRVAADGTGRQIEGQVAKSVALKDDLAFLTERGDRLADRLDLLVRAARPLAQDRVATNRSGATDRPASDRAQSSRPATALDAAATGHVSRTERDLMQALRMAR